MYERGQGVPQDEGEAVKWYLKAAEQGNAKAQLILGVKYIKGNCVPQNYIQAHMWFNLAAISLSGEDRDLAVKGRDAVTNRMTPAQIAEAQRLAREWKPKK